MGMGLAAAGGHDVYSYIMVRTQIYLTAQEDRLLGLLARRERRTKSEIIRGVLDERLAPGVPRVAAAAARQALGAWKGQSGRAELRRLRSHW